MTLPPQAHSVCGLCSHALPACTSRMRMHVHVHVLMLTLRRARVRHRGCKPYVIEAVTVCVLAGCNRISGELGFVAGDNLSVVTMGLSDGGVMWSETDFGDAPAERIATSEEALRARLDSRYVRQQNVAEATHGHGGMAWPGCSAPLGHRCLGGSVAALLCSRRSCAIEASLRPAFSAPVQHACTALFAS